MRAYQGERIESNRVEHGRACSEFLVYPRPSQANLLEEKESLGIQASLDAHAGKSG